MRILISNDDGIHAHGLKVLEKIAHTLSDDVWVVVPELDQSGSGHSLTLRDPLRLREVSDRKFAVSGTPTDCVMSAIYHLMKDHPPELVLSGVNNGANLAEDVTYSGTIAAAMEAKLLGVPSIALSLVTSNKHPPKWATAEHYAPDILKKLIAQKIPEHVLININFPDFIVPSVKGIKITSQGYRNMTDNLVQCTDPRGNFYYWIGAGDHRFCEPPVPPPAGTDLAAVREGYISITPLSLNLTHKSTASMLEGVFAE
ncbi:MAG: 5'/3'-nucleotidase SurE [Alphaproteobacteria bacterium]|nr:5'/3'-nucleotidase SurE [Alphaproteobacteria bacterium]